MVVASTLSVASAETAYTPYRVGMDVHAGATVVHYVEHGSGQAVLLLHGAGVDHCEIEACFEPIFDGMGDFRRIYPDLPGMGRTAAPAEARSADDVLGVLREFARQVTGRMPYLLIGHSAGAYFAQAMAAREPDRVAGLALICPLLPNSQDVPDHGVTVGSDEIGDAAFRNYFVIHTQEMLARYERYVVPGAARADEAALARIGEQWEITPAYPRAYEEPTLILAGRLDSTAGYAAALGLVAHYPHATVAVLDGTGHALPHERPDALHALTADWLARIDCAHPSSSLPEESTDVR